MTEAEFAQFREHNVDDYAREQQRAYGYSWPEALELAERSYTQLLPEGVRTAENSLFVVEDELTGRAVGHLWWAARSQAGAKRAFIYNIEVFEAERGKGFGAATMRALEDQVSTLGFKSIGLHVFAHNARARALYAKTGFHETGILMEKTL